jgi:hypothetical protein
MSNKITSNNSIPSRDFSPTSSPRNEEYGYSLRSNAYFNITPEPFTPRLIVGRVVEVNPQLQSYRVRIGNYPSSDIFATNLETLGSAVSTFSASSKLFGIGSSVIVLTSSYFGLKFGVILGSVPENFSDNVFMGSPELIPTSPVGSGVDKIAKTALNSSVHNFNAGRPIDTYPTDMSFLSYFGAGLFVGSLQATLRASSECAVECHYVDSLLRLTSYNFEQFSAGADTQFVADCGDYTEIRRGNPYVIESVGGVEQYGAFPKKEGKSRADVETPSVDLGQYVAEDENQTGWWRWLDLSGYLANVKLAFVIAPKLNGTRKGAEDNGQQDEHALFREHVDSTGAYSVASAKSISLIKDCLIPLPKEQYRADDSRGDNKEDIEKARNDNKLNLQDAELEGLEDNPDASVLYALASSDMASFRTHRTLVRFRERAKDWSLDEIEEIDLAGFKSVISSEGLLNPANNISKTRMYAALPKVGKLKINANEEVKYFASRSMIMMHEDGSIHIQDGYGAAISMRGGCIDITCPGDITLRPGRNLVGLAGDSASIIGGVDVELCGMKGDIRVQADRNVSVLSGNDGQGGILLETRATYAPLTAPDDETFRSPNTNANAYKGIWFKAPNSGVCTLANQAYVGNAKNNCKIVMDCGSSDFSVNGTTSYFLTSNSHFVTRPDDPESGTVLSVYGSAGFQMVTPGSMYIRSSSFMASGPSSNSGVTTDLNFYVKGNLNLLGRSIMEGIFVTESGGGGRPLPKIDNQEYINSVETPIGEILSEISQSVSEILQAKEELFNQVDESLVGSSESSLTNLTFYYPDSLLRGIPPDSKFVLLEADWQYAYRNKGVGENLEIRGVAESGAGQPGIAPNQSYCWPGLQALESKFGKLSAESRFIDENLAFRSSGFDQPLKVLDNGETSFHNNYRVIGANQIRIKE